MLADLDWAVAMGSDEGGLDWESAVVMDLDWAMESEDVDWAIGWGDLDLDLDLEMEMVGVMDLDWGNCLVDSVLGWV